VQDFCSDLSPCRRGTLYSMTIIGSTSIASRIPHMPRNSAAVRWRVVRPEAKGKGQQLGAVAKGGRRITGLCAASQSAKPSQLRVGRTPLGYSVLIRSHSANSCVRVQGKTPRGLAVEYKQFFVKAFEQKPGKWRARIKRLDGKPVVAARRDRAKVDEFVTSSDSSTPNDALLRAFAAIDVLTLRPAAEQKTPRH
jgi:hypothetical protein